jgi:hypothetical protein
VLKIIFYSLAALVRKILFSPLEDKSHIFAPPCNILPIYIYTVKQSLCNILNSPNIASNIANELYHRKLMFSGDIELNPGPVFL